MITTSKTYSLVKVSGMPEPDSVTLGNAMVSLDGGTNYYYSAEVRVRQPFLLAFNYEVDPAVGTRATFTFSIEVIKDGVTKQTINRSRTTPQYGTPYASSELIDFPSGVTEEGNWGLKVYLTAVTLTT